MQWEVVEKASKVLNVVALSDYVFKNKIYEVLALEYTKPDQG